jgi:hypothetical protein
VLLLPLLLLAMPAAAERCQTQTTTMNFVINYQHALSFICRGVPFVFLGLILKAIVNTSA